MIMVEKIIPRLQLSICSLVVFIGCVLIVPYFMISHRIYELVSLVPGVELFVSVIVPDRCRFPEGICEA